VVTILWGFVERVNLRFGIAHSVHDAEGGPLFWFGFDLMFRARFEQDFP
jgi:hypothetical protein